MPSKIEWLKDDNGVIGETWNPITGCSPVSEGCQNCYAARMAKRLAGRCGYPKENPFEVTFHEHRLSIPSRWQKPHRIFVDSMGDLFHEKVYYIWLDRITDVMRSNPRHTFIVLTKRPRRMAEYFDRSRVRLSNIWLGVTCENQRTADERIPILLQIPAAVRFVSCEPLLGPIDLTGIQFDKWTNMNVLEGCGVSNRPGYGGQMIPNASCKLLDWVIAGAETGPGARPMDPHWAGHLWRQCKQAGVPFFFKKWGGYYPECPERFNCKTGQWEHGFWKDIEATRQFPERGPAR